MPVHTVLLTGGTGFIGRHVLAGLLQRGYRVRCLVRRGSTHRLPQDKRVVPVEGNVLDGPSCCRAAEGVQAAIHLVGIIRETGDQTFERVHVEGTHNVVAACVAASVGRLVHMSAHGASPGSRAAYHRTKAAAEQLVAESSTAWTIFRPSVILGADGEFLRQILALVRPMWRPVPVLGDGHYVLQPVGVEEVAEAIVRALEMPQAAGKIYTLAGPRAVTFDEFLDTLSRVACGRRRAKLHLPWAMVGPLVAVAERLLSNPPITSEQLVMLREAMAADTSAAESDLAWRGEPLEELLRRIVTKEEVHASAR
ncbi:MAG: complex I NDUFA9 subunit family protein [Planctomycetes bacterium]|nr:complex I NDUFA9 subunit family protein [Planctomycetota bacterium]